ncbi:MAG: DUF177 domain-containing protein [Caldimicrobium sp.]
MKNNENLSNWGISLEEIPLEGLNFAFEDLSDFGKDLKVLKPFSGNLKLIKRGFEVVVEGHISGSVELSCDRCLENFEYNIDEDFKVLLLPKNTLNLQEEKELTSEDLEVSFYESSFISFFNILQEEIFLALPYRNLCKENCKGLCPHCGTNLNAETCECFKIKKGSPFAVLKNLINPKEKNL